MSVAQALPQRNLTWREALRQRLWRSKPVDVAPVTLQHSRIYVLPTQRGLAFLASLLIMLLTSLNYSLSLGFMVVFLLAGFAASALLHTFRNLLGLSIRPLTAGEGFAGGTLPFVVAIMGGAGIRRGFTLDAADGAGARFDVPAGTALAVTVHRAAPHRGRLALGRVTLASDYPVGLWRAWAYVHFTLDGIVYPAPEPSPPPLPDGAHAADGMPGRAHEDTDLAGVREYQRGDPAQRIAWKTVARGAGWYSKQFEGGAGGGPVTLSWHALPSGMGREARIARLTAWVLTAERVARPFSLELPGSHVGPGQGRDQRRHALTALALLSDGTP